MSFARDTLNPEMHALPGSLMGSPPALMITLQRSSPACAGENTYS